MIDKRPPPLFLADSLALDFLNSLAAPVDQEVEWLANGAQLLAWLEVAGLVDAAMLKEVRTLAKPGELDEVASQARGLREWFRDFVVRHRGRPLTRNVLKELGPLNLLLARDEQFSQIVACPRATTDEGNLPLKLVPQRRWGAADALLFPVAEKIAQLLTSADFTYVKRCEGPACVLHFLDTTSDRRRRWCCMAVCGNRAKQAAYRSRKAAAGK
jgi:predicted RNA-binding Zn ribbon-like protein